MAFYSSDDAPSNSRRKWSDGIEVFKTVPKKYHIIRLIPPFYTDFRHTIATSTGKAFSTFCHGYDSENDRHVDDRDAHCEVCRLDSTGIFRKDDKGQTKNTKGLTIQSAMRFFVNVVDYEAWERHLKAPQAGIVFIKLLEMPKSVFDEVRKLKQLNEGFGLEHPERGALIGFMFDPDEKGSKMYSVQYKREWALPKELFDVELTQEFPDGERRIMKAKGKLPAGYEYQRALEPKNDLIASLRRNGYYDVLKNEGGEAGQKTLNEHNGSVKSDVARQAFSSSTPLPSIGSSSQADDAAEEDPVPAPRKQEPARQQAQPSPSSSGGASALKHPSCPTDFGEFADDIICYTKCKAKTTCRAATAQSQGAQKAMSTESSDDEDDSV